MANIRQIRLAEIEEHINPDDLWLLIENKVYDVTKYRLEHPGGEEVMDEAAGRDATKDFLDVGHSEEARLVMKKYYIGDLAECDRPSKMHVKCMYAVGALLLGFGTVFLIRRALAGRQ